MSRHPGPLTDSDTFDVLDDALTALAQRRATWLGDETTVIHLLASLIDQAERCLPEAVTTARANGHSWHDIAAARHQPRRGQTALRPRLTHRRREVATEHTRLSAQTPTSSHRVTNRGRGQPEHARGGATSSQHSGAKWACHSQWLFGRALGGGPAAALGNPSRAGKTCPSAGQLMAAATPP